MVLLEAQSYHCLTVTTNVPGCYDGLAPEMRNFLCDYSEASLFDALERAINLPDDQAGSLGEKAATWVSENHNMPLVTDLYLKFFAKSGFLES